MNTSRVVDRRAIWGWSIYDFANSSFTTIVVTFIYAAYFVQGIAADETSGTGIWSLGVTATAIFVALASPFVGAMADRGGYRKRFLFIATVGAILGSVILFFPTSGQITFAICAFVFANVAFEMANVFYNAFLPDIAPQEKIGRISGYGWALGYAGGLLCLVIALFALVQTETPVFGFSTEGGENIRATSLLVAAWFAIFSIPTFLWLKEEKVEFPDSYSKLFGDAAKSLRTTFQEIKDYRQIFRLLLARLIYNDGLVTIFAFGGIYAKVTFGFTFTEVIYFGIALNLAAGIGAWIFGFVDDRIGGKKTIMFSLVGLIIASGIAVAAPTKAMFWVSGILVGLLVGPNQSASRSLMGRFVPDDKESEFYGFFAFSGKATAFLGPFFLGRLTEWFGNQRAGVAIVLVFFFVGAILLTRVDEKEGIARAGRPELQVD
ncbi:MAG: MFS transporter [Rhodothermales bacterium]|nr:MFS transporter [Rhodothermales bacterium]